MSDPAYSQMRLDAFEVRRAENGRSRRRGMLGLDSAPEWGLLLDRCPLIHMFGMCFALDVVFCDRKMRVKRIYENVPSGPRLRGSFTGWHCLELPAGTARSLGIEPGQLLELDQS